MIHVYVKEMHGDIPQVMRIFNFDNLIDAQFFANKLILEIKDHQWVEVDLGNAA